jgi:hypothetical protein
MQFWQCPLLLMVSLIAAINTQQTPSQRLQPNQVAGLAELHQQLEQPRDQQSEQHQQQPEQPAQADNKVRSYYYTRALSLSCRYFMLKDKSIQSLVVVVIFSTESI